MTTLTEALARGPTVGIADDLKTSQPQPNWAVRGEVVTVTPEMAARWLENNVKYNRPLDQSRVVQHAAAMKAGRWALDGQPLIFDRDGMLLNGQHRLWACLEAEVPFTTMVVRGVDPSAFASIDTGKPRSAGDVLTIAAGQGLLPTGYASKLATATTACLHYERRDLSWNKSFSREDVVDYAVEHPELLDWVRQACGPVSNFRAHVTLAAAVCSLAGRGYPEAAANFLQACVKGANLEPTNPVLHLRNKLLTAGRKRQCDRFLLIAAAWNHWVDGNTVRLLRLPTNLPDFRIKGAGRG